MDLISMSDLDRKTVDKLLDRAAEIQQKGVSLKGILATLFFEPSTRTKLSFQSAALRSGMAYIDLDPESSSLKKGESFEDTIRMVSGYADVIAVRHPKEGSAKIAANVSEIPVINAGDGANQHPTQALIDLYTIRKCKGKIKDVKVTLIGDLKYARAMRSLAYGLAMYGAKIFLVSPKGLEMDPAYVEELKEKFNAEIFEIDSPDYSKTDVLYVCRVQQERFSNKNEAKKIMEKFMIKKSDLAVANKDLIILHPLPKVNEIDPAIDEMKQAKYFEQAHNGIAVRQAVLEYALK